MTLEWNWGGIGWYWRPIQLSLYELVSFFGGGIGHDFGVVLGWYWVVLGGIGSHLARDQRHGRNIILFQLCLEP